jgi:alpha-mannosidase
MNKSILIMLIVLGLCVLALAQTDSTQTQRDLYVVATSHLDTQWRWTIRNTIDEYIPATFRENMKLMDIYPDYVFSFEGAIKYMFLKEYYPDEFQKVKKYIDRGQWRVAGSWVDAVDVNMPSFESLVRQTLYGNGFYKQEFGKTSKDILLPDCFGFGYALPSIARHCGLESFSTQKLTWGSSVGVPFDIGIWKGVDGSTIAAALNPGDYTGRIKGDLSRDTTWLAQINRQGDSTGFYSAYRYFGTGDTGGPPESLSVDWLSKSIKSNGPVKVHSIGSDDLNSLLESHIVITDPPAKTSHPINLSIYNGELLMTRHGAGCYTSQAAMKRWNRKNELLADATERACVIANQVAGAPYPKEDIKREWIRFLYHQFHDDLTGTSIPEAYQFSWNDEIIAQNRLSAMLEHAIEATASVMDTRAKGIPVVVFNPLSIEREDVVELTIPCMDTIDGKSRSFMTFKVYDNTGYEVPSSVVECNHLINKMKINFMATVPSVGYAVYDIRPSKDPCKLQRWLSVSENSLENKHYKVKVDEAGQITSIYDKAYDKELLSAPIALQFIHDKPRQWPAWEIQYEDIIAPPMTGKIKSTAIEILETGPTRVSLGITQKTDSSIIHTVISLAAGDAGNKIEFDYSIDWYERETLLKAAFPFSTPNDSVTYDIGLGTIKRGINTSKKYEVPAHQWADMTAADGSYSIAVMNDCKYGWDHPDSATLRLSLIHTPGVFESWNWVGDQKSQDNGHHEFKFAISGHKGDWRDGAVVWEAARFNQPLMAFRTKKHEGPIGKTYSFVEVHTPPYKNPERILWDIKDNRESWEYREKTIEHKNRNPQIKITAMKIAEDGDDIVLRLQEQWGKTAPNIETMFMPFRDIEGGKGELYGSEEFKQDYEIKDSMGFPGMLCTSFKEFQPKTFDFKIESAVTREYDPQSSKMIGYQVKPSKLNYLNIRLPFTLDGISLDSNRKDGDFDGAGNTLSGDLLPDTLHWLDIPYVFGPKADGQNNAVACDGQTLTIPDGGFDKLYLLGSAVNGPTIGKFKIDSKEVMIPIQDYNQFIGQWNSRVISGEIREDIADIAPGYINREPIAWVGTHRHNAKSENEAYQFTYLYLIPLDLPSGAKTVTLPLNKNIRILAATAVKSNTYETKTAQPLYDELQATLTDIQAPQKNFLDKTSAALTCPIPGAEVRYTLDNSDPTKSSPLYLGPIEITKAATLKSRAFLDGVDDHYVTSVVFHQLFPHDAVAIKSLAPGLDCKYFEGEWAKVPDFDTIKAKQTSVANTINLPSIARNEDFGLTFDGYIAIPKDGLYTFNISSDDGSFLNISDSLVVDNDGLHGEGDMPGQIALKAGYHPIAVRMFQSKGGRALDVAIEGPDMEYQKIPASMLFHKPKK